MHALDDGLSDGFLLLQRNFVHYSCKLFDSNYIHPAQISSARSGRSGSEQPERSAGDWGGEEKCQRGNGNAENGCVHCNS